MKNITLKPIRSEEEYDNILEWVDEQFDKKIKPATAEGDQLEAAILSVKAYEDKHYQIPYPA